MLPAIVVDCSEATGRVCISDFYLTLSTPVLLLLLLPILGRRSRTLLCVDVSAQLAAHAARGCIFALRRLLYACCAAGLCALNVAAACYAASGDDMWELRQHGTPAGDGWRSVFVACYACGAAMWAAILTEVVLETWYRHNSSRGLRLWYVAATVPAVIRLTSHALRTSATDVAAEAEAIGGSLERDRALRIAGASLVVLLGLAAFWEPDTPSGTGTSSGFKPFPEDEDETAAAWPDVLLPHAPPPEARASFGSRLFFAWCDGLLRTGAARPLEHGDLHPLQQSDATGRNARVLRVAWAAEEASGRRSFLRAWHRAFGGYFWATGLLELLRLSVQFALPELNRTILRYLAGGGVGAQSGGVEGQGGGVEGQGGGGVSGAAAVLCAAGVLGASVIQSLAQGQYNYRGQRLALRTRVAVGQAIYSQALQLGFRERQRFGTGAVVSYMQIDASKLGDATTYLHMLWSCPLQIGIGTAMLYRLLSTAGFAALGVMMLAMPLNAVRE